MSKRRTGQKRGHHEGSISWFEPRQCYRASIMFEGRRRYSYGKTRAECSRKLDEVKRQLLDGSLPTGSKSVRAFVQDWLEEGKLAWAPKTYANRKSLLNRHVLPEIGRHRLDRLQVEHVQRVYSRMKEADCSATLIDTVHRTLHACLQQAHKVGYVARNVARLTTRGKVIRPEKPRVTEEELHRLLEAARESRIYPLVILGVSTGGRTSELLGLTWSQVDLDAGRIKFSRQLKNDIDGNWTLGQLKTKNSVREVEIGTSVVDVLRTHRLEQSELRMRVGSAWQEHDLVFCTNVGTPLAIDNIRARDWKQVVAASGIGKHLKLYSLRDIFASMMLGRGMNLLTVSHMLGHRDPSTTLRHYSWAMPDSGRIVANTMENVLTGSG